MTNDNYTQLSNSAIIELVDSLGISTRGLLQHLKHSNQKLLEEIVKRTEFLPLKSKISARLYCIKNDLDSVPKCQCPNCGNDVPFGKDGF